MLHLNNNGTVRQITRKIAFLILLLALIDIAYILFRGSWMLVYGLIDLPQRGWILGGDGLTLSTSLMWPLSVVLLLTSLPTPHFDKRRIRLVGAVTTAFMMGNVFISLLFSKHSLLNLIVPPIFIIFSVSIILFLLFTTTKSWHWSALIVMGVWFTIYPIAFFKLPDAIKFGLPPIYFVFGLLNITVGYINLKSSTKKLEKILKAESTLLVLLGLYRLYLMGGGL